MLIPLELRCQDFGAPGCLETPDPAQTMAFDDIGEAPIYFCAACGPRAHAITAALQLALETRGPEFARQVDDALTQAEAQAAETQN